MSLTTRVWVDGEILKEGSAKAVAVYVDTLRAAEVKMSEARSLIGFLPDSVQNEWIDRHNKASRALTRLVSPASMFSHDYAHRGLESAEAEARFRKELK